MKAPNKGFKIYRNQESRIIETGIRLPEEFGMAPNGEWCEDTCHQNYDIGSDQHTSCLDRCRD